MKNHDLSQVPRQGEDNMPGADASKRILIVDDDEIIREIMAEFLVRFNFKVARAEDGRKALALFKARPFDLVITDLKMPVMDGLTVMARIKALVSRTPVVVLTGLAAEEVEQMDGIDSSAAILYKPFKLDVLEKVLIRIFE